MAETRKGISQSVERGLSLRGLAANIAAPAVIIAVLSGLMTFLFQSIDSRISDLNEDVQALETQLAGSSSSTSGRIDAIGLRIDEFATSLTTLSASVDQRLAVRVDGLTLRIDRLVDQQLEVSQSIASLTEQINTLTSRTNELSDLVAQQSETDNPAHLQHLKSFWDSNPISAFLRASDSGFRNTLGSKDAAFYSILIHYGVDLRGNDLGRRATRVKSVADCLVYCYNLKNCAAFSYVERENMCFPKSKVGLIREKPGVISSALLDKLEKDGTERLWFPPTDVRAESMSLLSVWMNGDQFAATQGPLRKN